MQRTTTKHSPLARRFRLGSLLRFAAPSIGMMIIISLYTVTDGIFIGRYAGSDALAASNIVYPAINVVFGLVYFYRYSHLIRFTRPRLEWRALGQAFYNGSSELVTQLSVGITTFLFNILTFRYAGADGVAAISVILYAEMLLTAVYMGFTNGIAPIFSYRFGARDFGELRRLVRLSLTVIAGSALLSFSLSHLLAEPLVSLFLPQGGHVYELTRQGFALFSFTFLLCGFNLFISGFFTAISDGRTSALMSFARNLLGIVFFLLTLPRMLGLSGVWLAVPAADVTALLFGTFLLVSRMREFKDMDTAQKEIRLTDIKGRNA